VGAVVRVLDVVETLPSFGGTTDSSSSDERLWIRTRCDAGGKILAIEGTVEQLYGMNSADLVGGSSFDLVHPDDLHTVMAGARSSYQAPGRASTHHLRICRPDGTVVPVMVEVRITPSLDEFHTYVRDAGQAMRDELAAAVAGDELRLVYQPVHEVGTGRMIGAEALVRWIHPERGDVSPADFIPLAELTDAIVEVGAWVLHQACHEAVTWPEHLRIAVNLSVRQLADRSIVDTVRAALESSGLAPRRLLLEVTESALMDNAERALSHLHALKDLGVELAIDDFGTGYSSLQYLSRMPVNLLKVDRSFVAGLGQNEGDTFIVTSVIALAHALGLRVVAEGVETDRQHRHLTALGCDAAQGFLWSRPVPPDLFHRLAKEPMVERHLTLHARDLDLSSPDLEPAIRL
jgi:PAS domain S-box-containing protein